MSAPLSLQAAIDLSRQQECGDRLRAVRVMVASAQLSAGVDGAGARALLTSIRMLVRVRLGVSCRGFVVLRQFIYVCMYLPVYPNLNNITASQSGMDRSLPEVGANALESTAVLVEELLRGMQDGGVSSEDVSSVLQAVDVLCADAQAALLRQ